MLINRHILSFTFCLLFFWGFGQTGTIQKSTFNYKDTLQFDFYRPNKAVKKPAPLLVLLHGGGFASGKKDGPGETYFCTKMAEKGYAVASINYRLTRKNDPFSCDCATEKKMASFVSAAEDLSAAVRFMKAAKELDFDRNTIVLIGSSAGAEAVLHSTYMNHHYRFSHIQGFPIAGVVSFSGAIVNADYITENNAVPALFIHGKKDKLVPYGTAPHHFCDENREGYLMLDGPATLTKKLQDQKASFILAFDPEGGHSWADKAYRETELVDRFVKDIVLSQKFIQSYIRLAVPGDAPKISGEEK